MNPCDVHLFTVNNSLLGPPTIHLHLAAQPSLTIRIISAKMFWLRLIYGLCNWSEFVIWWYVLQIVVEHFLWIFVSLLQHMIYRLQWLFSNAENVLVPGIIYLICLSIWLKCIFVQFNILHSIDCASDWNQCLYNWPAVRQFIIIISSTLNLRTKEPINRCVLVFRRWIVNDRLTTAWQIINWRCKCLGQHS